MNRKKILHSILLACFFGSVLLATNKIEKKAKKPAKYHKYNKNRNCANEGPVPSKIEPILPVTHNLQPGKYIEGIWIGSGYNSQQDLALGEIKYDTKISNKTVTSYLPIALNAITQENAPWQLVITVNKFTESIYSYRPYIDHKIKLSGQILNEKAIVVAEFQAEQVFNPKEYWTKRALKQMVYAIKQELTCHKILV